MNNQPGEGRREAARLEAFSDGVMAVIITIMALLRPDGLPQPPRPLIQRSQR